MVARSKAVTMHLLVPGELTSMPRARGGSGPHQANLRLLREEDLGLAAMGSLRRDLWWWRHLKGAKG